MTGHASPARELLHVHDVSPAAILVTRFFAAALNRPHHVGTQWGCDLDEIPDLAGTTARKRAGRDREALVERDGLVAFVELESGGVSVRAAAQTAADVEAFVAEVRDLMPQTAPDDDRPEIPVTFWSYHPMGVRSRRRRITVPSWPAILANYPEATLRDITPLIYDFAPGAGGQLLLWHGPPGTGKTFMLRALGWEWRDWCDLHYITDPEVLFGDNASYLLDVLLDQDDDVALKVGRIGGDDDLEEDDEPRVDPRAAEGRWRLLVLEDTGEMMSADARERAGQGLGRLLNVVDGLIGQGLRILVLVTTNERLTKLHPAVARAGRCASSITFHPLPLDEARAWLRDREVPEDRWPEDWRHPTDAPRTVTAADLYAVLGGTDLHDREAASVGFTA